ncbi:MAG TPA: hypothetical protein VHH35_21545, partial [Pyrinomonadaceae bacterium]|nr:hypothetical protein [Pyrinomonadaceae bacterium]
RNKWLGLLRGHAQSLEHELSALRRDLTPFLSGGGSAEGVQIDSDRDLQQAIHRLFQLCAAADQAVRSSFTISASDSSTVAIKLPQFVRSLDQAEKLARQIQSVATVDF